MTPQEKAKELVEKYQNLLFINITNKPNKIHPDSIQCAVIAVDEIIDTGLLSLSATENKFLAPVTESYWQEVKQEIQKL